MLTAKLTVEDEGDWTSELGRYDVSGELLASAFRDRRYFGLLVLEVGDGFVAVIETIREHESTTSVDVIEEYGIGDVNRVSATLLIRSHHFDCTACRCSSTRGSSHSVASANYGTGRNRSTCSWQTGTTSPRQSEFSVILFIKIE